MANALKLCLLLAFLFFSPIGIVIAGQDVTDPEKRADQELGKQLAKAIAAQRKKQNSTLQVEAQIVEEAPKAVLTSGDGDVSTTGECEEDMETFCEDIEPGEGRLAQCLTKQVESESKGNSEGGMVSEECKQELSAFKIDRGTNINKDPQLARSCRLDVKRLCSALPTNGTDAREVIRCLRSQRKNLSPDCKRRVFMSMLEESRDFRVDPDLRAACQSDAAALCKDADPQEGGILDCLLSNRGEVSGVCQDELQRVEEERAGDARLSRPLMRSCAAEIKEYCGEVEFGEGRVYVCLEEHREESGFSAGCRRAVEAVIQRQASDYKLNYGLREWCREDIAELCQEEKAQIELTEGAGADSQVITCLETQRARIRNNHCRVEVWRQVQREAQDVRFDHALAQRCFADRQKFCANVQPGSARVLRCLQEHQRDLTTDCAAAMFDQEVKMAEDIDFKYPLKQACLVEIDIFCKNVPHGHARVIRCLQQRLDNSEMSRECRAEVRRDSQRSSTDYRLNYRLKQACEEDVGRHCQHLKLTCSGEKTCSGQVLQCLQEHLDELVGEECKAEVFYFIKMEVNDYRNDVVLAEACREDVTAHCSTVEPGGGAVHACLREHMEGLSQDCRREELKLAIIEARDVRLRPKLQRTCSEELAVFCGDISPGRGRMFRCLQDNLGKADFGTECREEVSRRIRQSQENWRLDFGVSSQCEQDVDALCSTEKGQAHAPAVVLKCLVTNYESASVPCQSELSRSVRMALWDYSPGAALTETCDADVQRVCPPSPSQHSMYTIGTVGRCLSRQAAQGGQLDDGCRRLVMVAAPKNVKAVFDDSNTVDAVATRVAEIARAAGLSSTFVSRSGKGVSAVTLTGWVVLGAIWASIAVGVVAGVVAVRRYMGWSRPQYTLVVKQGDV